MGEMHVVKAGDRELIALDLDPGLVSKIASQSGYSCKVSENARAVTAELTADSREGPLLLFDAADSANLGWFSRCQFYVDGHTGAVLQTPLYVGNLRDSRGRPMAQSVRVQISKEIPVGVKIAGRQQVNEQVVYGVLASFLTALQQTGVAVCGGSVVRPLAGRVEEGPSRN